MSQSKLNVLITGANRGIGLALAKHFKSKGHNVIGTSRNISDDAVEELRKVAAAIVPLDVNNVNSIESLPKRLSSFSPIDILVNNSGVYERDSLETVTMESMHSTFQINTVGPLLVTKALLPKLASQSKVIQISSSMGSIADNASGGAYSYRASKAALNMVNKSLSVDLPNHICVALHPGYIQTRMTGGQGDMGPEPCAEKLVHLILGFDKSCSGKFFHREGHELQWIIGLGIDLLNLHRIVQLIHRFKPVKLQNRILSPLELQNVPNLPSLNFSHTDPWVRYIGLSWAAKEALYKACSPYTLNYSWKDVSVVKCNEKPILQIHATHPNVKIQNTHLSVSHEENMLAVVVLVEGEFSS